MAGFVGWLRQAKEPTQIVDIHEIQAARKPATINVILGCLSSFYRFHNQIGNTDVKVTEGVTKAWLYKQPRVRELIKQARGTTNNLLMRDQAIQCR